MTGGNERSERQPAGHVCAGAGLLPMVGWSYVGHTQLGHGTAQLIIGKPL